MPIQPPRRFVSVLSKEEVVALLQDGVAGYEYVTLDLSSDLGPEFSTFLVEHQIHEPHGTLYMGHTPDRNALVNVFVPTTDDDVIVQISQTE